MSEFWSLVDDEFGRAQGRVLVRDHVVGTLGHRTPEQALAAGEDPRTVWSALVDDLHVPEERRWGREDPKRSAPEVTVGSAGATVTAPGRPPPGRPQSAATP